MKQMLLVVLLSSALPLVAQAEAAYGGLFKQQAQAYRQANGASPQGAPQGVAQSLPANGYTFESSPVLLQNQRGGGIGSKLGGMGSLGGMAAGNLGNTAGGMQGMGAISGNAGSISGVVSNGVANRTLGGMAREQVAGAIDGRAGKVFEKVVEKGVDKAVDKGTKVAQEKVNEKLQYGQNGAVASQALRQTGTSGSVAHWVGVGSKSLQQQQATVPQYQTDDRQVGPRMLIQTE